MDDDPGGARCAHFTEGDLLLSWHRCSNLQVPGRSVHSDAPEWPAHNLNGLSVLLKRRLSSRKSSFTARTSHHLDPPQFSCSSTASLASALMPPAMSALFTVGEHAVLVLLRCECESHH
jgi:hypothetical protein